MNNILEGKPLRYLIGAENGGTGNEGEITECPYALHKVRLGISVAYGNLFDELNTGNFGPYLRTSDTAVQYNEGQIDPAGDGWDKNLKMQCTRIKAAGFQFMEWDNPDAYDIKDVIYAVDYAQKFGLGVLAKNAGQFDLGDAIQYLKHENIWGCIVERDCGRPNLYEYLRKEAGKPTLPIWFVFFGNDQKAANEAAESIEENHYLNMGVTFSPRTEYTTSKDILVPITE